MRGGAGGGDSMRARVHVPTVLAAARALPRVPQRGGTPPAPVHGWLMPRICDCVLQAPSMHGKSRSGVASAAHVLLG